MTNYRPILGAQFVDYTQEFMKALQMRQFLEHFMEQQRVRREEQENPFGAALIRGGGIALQRAEEVGLGDDPRTRGELANLLRLGPGTEARRAFTTLQAPGRVKSVQQVRQSIAEFRNKVSEIMTSARFAAQIRPLLAADPARSKDLTPDMLRAVNSFASDDPVSEARRQVEFGLDSFIRSIPPDALEDFTIQNEMRSLRELIGGLGGGSPLGSALSATPGGTMTPPSVPLTTPQLPGVRFPGQ